jgi:hypothetical protein
VRIALELVAVILLPTAVGYAMIGGVRVAGRLSDWRYARAANSPTAPVAEPIERLGANLRRLRAELEATENQMGTPAKGLRLRALRAAYIDALCTACQRLEVSPPPGMQGGRAEIYRVEAALRQRGLDVREAAPR